VALDVGIVGLSNAGKTTLFNALTRAGAEITAYATVSEKSNVGMAPIADERLDRVAAVVGARKVTPAAVRVVDVPGSGRALLGNLRQVDALLVVTNGWAPDADPKADRETIELELLMADREHVERRLERVEKQAKSGDASLRAEAEELRQLVAHLDGGRSLAEWPRELPPELEAELAELPEDEAAEFRDGPSALDEVVQRLFDALGLLSFFTAGDKETRAWTLRRGQTALDAAETIHTDIARGFIRCEVIRWGDLVECGSHAEAARRGLQRLEGKTYEVEDGDVLNIRFNV
jgi:ribosome-binding ATPase YchF (GTP1/OBG family)